MENKEYTLTGFSETYKIDPFTVTPRGCSIDYSYEVEEIDGSGETTNIEQLISFNDDEASRTFSFFYASDLKPAGDTFREYKITIKAVSGLVAPVSTETSFNLKVYNPCQDKDYVQVVAPTVPA